MNEKLSDEQIASLFTAFHAKGDLTARDALFSHYSYLANVTARKFIGRGVDYEDLVQVASLALLRVIERFDPARGLAFSTFAIPSLVGELKNYFRDKAYTIRLPRQDTEQMSRLQAAIEAFEQLHARRPNAAELAAAMGIQEERVLELLEAQSASSILSLDGYTEESEGSLSAILGAEDADLAAVEARDLLTRAMRGLSEQEKHIITERYIGGKTQREIAEGLGVSQMHISRRERLILQKMRRNLEA